MEIWTDGGREQNRNIPHRQCKAGQPAFIVSDVHGALEQLWEGNGLKKPSLASRKQLCGKKNERANTRLQPTV